MSEDPATDLAVRSLAKLKGKSLTETIREAADNEYKRECERVQLAALGALEKPHFHEWIKARSGPNPQPADKAFYDELSGEF